MSDGLQRRLKLRLLLLALQSRSPRLAGNALLCDWWFVANFDDRDCSIEPSLIYMAISLVHGNPLGNCDWSAVCTVASHPASAISPLSPVLLP